MLKNKLFRYSAVLLALAVFVGFNLASYVVHLRFDATDGQTYTLSDSTKQIAQDAPAGVTIEVFLSKNLPPQVASSKQHLQDLLSEYAAAGANIDLKYVDPASDDKAKELANALRIPELSLQVIEKDQQQVLKTYFGLAVLKDAADAPAEDAGPLAAYEKYETIPVIQDFSNFEYDLTAALRKISATNIKSIGFLAGHGEHEPLSTKQPTNQFEAMMMQSSEHADYPVQDILEKTFTVRTVFLREDQPQIGGVDTLVVAGPTSDLPDYAITAIHDFIAAGGNAIFLLDGLDITDQLSTQAITSSYDDLLAPWGLAVSPELIADASHAQANFNRGFMTFSLPYPFWLKVRNLSSTNSATAELDSFVLPWASPITITPIDSVTTEVLASTSSQYQRIAQQVTQPEAAAEGAEPAGPQTQPINLDPQQQFNIGQDAKSPLPLVVRATKEGQGSVLLVGESDFVSNRFGKVMDSSRNFFFNAIDAFTLGDELISIRSKGVTDRPLADLSEGMKTALEWGNILGMSFVFIIYGLIRRQLRLAKKTAATLG